MYCTYSGPLFTQSNYFSAERDVTQFFFANNNEIIIRVISCWITIFVEELLLKTFRAVYKNKYTDIQYKNNNFMNRTKFKIKSQSKD